MAASVAGVLVVGSLNVDFVVHVPRLPLTGETVTGGTFARYSGGKGANQAVAAARFGAATMFVGAVGDDEIGVNELERLRADGVDTSRCLIVPGIATGVALIVVDDAGQNQIAVASGANAALDGEAVDETLAMLDEADLERLRGGVVLANLEVADDAVIAAGRFAQRHGMRFVLNVAPARPLPAELLQLGPLIVANEAEAAALGGSLAGVETVVVTRGAAGAEIRQGSSVAHVPAPVVETVDTTGAGDAFCGVLAAALCEGMPLSAATDHAVQAAALSTTVPGAREGMPRRDVLATI